MKFNLIVDSCCDMPMEMQKEHNVSVAPLSVTIDEDLYMDDEHLNMDDFIKNMLACKKLTSGSPSPASYLNNMKKDAVNFIVTLSSKLSGSFSSAIAAKNLIKEELCDVHVFDSKSASAGELLIALKVKELISAGLQKSEIISTINNFINELKTYYVTQDLSNFIKSGRLSNLKGKILTVLGVRPILGSDGNGDIALYSHARGEKQTLAKFIELIKSSGKITNGADIIITHCNNSDLAFKLREMIEETFHFKKVIVAQTRGISSMYVNNKGVIMSF